MAIDYYKLSQGVNPVAAAIQGVVSLLDKTNTFPSIQLLIWPVLFFFFFFPS